MTNNAAAPSSSNEIFTLQELHPDDYRQQTRKATFVIVLIFTSIAMFLASLLALVFGSPTDESSNFKLNLTGVLLGVVVTAILTNSILKKQPWMAASVYGWRLKRSLMSVTNSMHCVKAGVDADDILAMRVLRFYHLGLIQMQHLDGNPGLEPEQVRDINALQDKMQGLNLDLQQNSLNPDWISQLKAKYPAK